MGPQTIHVIPFGWNCVYLYLATQVFKKEKQTKSHSAPV